MRWRTLLVALLAVTAGCSALSGTDEPTATATPVPVPEVRTEQPTPDGIAPGLETDGIRNVDRLAAAHVEAVANTSYVWRSSTRVDRLPDAAGDEHVVRETLSVESERRYRYYTNRRDLDSRGDTRLLANLTEYADGETTYRRYRPFGEREFVYLEQPARPASQRYGWTVTNPIRQYLAVSDATVYRASVDGQRYYRVEAERGTVPGIAGGTDYTVSALVSREGFVRSMNVTYELQRNTLTELVRYSFRYERPESVTVEPPGWVAERRSAESTSTRD